MKEKFEKIKDVVALAVGAIVVPPLFWQWIYLTGKCHESERNLKDFQEFAEKIKNICKKESE